MKKALQLGLIFLFVLSLGACAGGKQSGIEVKDATSKTRFAVSSDGVISDAGTGLQWVTGPNVDVAYSSASIWVTNCKVAGGGWRMPTLQELETLHPHGVGQNIMGQAFKATDFKVWAEAPSSTIYCSFDFSAGSEYHYGCGHHKTARVFAVRSRPR